MISLGNWNEMTIVRFTDHGAYLDGGDAGEILMPRAYVRPEMRPGDTVTVFVYLDQQERAVATTETPLARVGDFACLRVNWTNRYGAFLDWGLMKDLFVPFAEQREPMQRGRSYIIYVRLDERTRRIVGTARVDRYLRPAPADYARGREVRLLVWQRTPLGYKVIVDGAYAGLVYADSLYEDVHVGQELVGTVVTRRDDGKLDIAPGHIGPDRFRDFADALLDELQAAGGELPFTDDSPADAIRARFGVSKKTFKRALGTLYKQRLVSLDEGKIKLIHR